MSFTRRSWAEYLGGTRFTLHHPCGHQEPWDPTKGPIARRIGPMGCKLMAHSWSFEGGGITATCRICFPKGKKHPAPDGWRKR